MTSTPYSSATFCTNLRISTAFNPSLTCVENVDPAQAGDVEETIKNTISQQIGVPIGDLDVDYNTDTGEVKYTVQTDSYAESNGIHANIDNDSFTNAIKSSLSGVDSGINVTSPMVEDDVVANVNIVVDGKDIIDINDATNNLSDKFSDDGFIVQKAEGRLVFLSISHFLVLALSIYRTYCNNECI